MQIWFLSTPHTQSTHIFLYREPTPYVSSGGESIVSTRPLHLHTATRGFTARVKLQPASYNHLR